MGSPGCVAGKASSFMLKRDRKALQRGERATKVTWRAEGGQQAQCPAAAVVPLLLQELHVLV